MLSKRLIKIIAFVIIFNKLFKKYEKYFQRKTKNPFPSYDIKHQRSSHQIIDGNSCVNSIDVNYFRVKELKCYALINYVNN